MEEIGMGMREIEIFEKGYFEDGHQEETESEAEKVAEKFCNSILILG